LILGVTAGYGAVVEVLNAEYGSSNWLLLLLIGYVIMLTALLRKFGGSSVRRGAAVGALSVLGAACGWIVASALFP